MRHIWKPWIAYITENSAKNHIRRKFPKIRGFSKAHTCIQNQDAKLSNFDQKLRKHKQNRIKIQRKKDLNKTLQEIEEAENDHKESYAAIHQDILAIRNMLEETYDDLTFWKILLTVHNFTSLILSRAFITDTFKIKAFFTVFLSFLAGNSASIYFFAKLLTPTLPKL